MSWFPYSSRRAAVAAFLALAVSSAACSKETSDAPAAGADEPSAVPVAQGAATTPAPAASTAPAAPVSPEQAAQTAAAQQAQRVMKPEEVPAVVARIDGNDVTRADLLARASEARGALAQRGLQPPQLTYGFLRSVLDDIIGNRLLARDLTAEGSVSPTAEIDAQVQSIRSQFPSEEEFDKALGARGFDRERLRRDVAESLTVNKWVNGTVVPSLTVAEADARAFYEASPARMVEPEKVRARHILVRVEPQATPEAKAAQRQKIDQARTRLTGGADFAVVAKELSDDKPSGERGGDLGWFYRGQMVPQFDGAAFSLEPKQLSGVVETQYGFHLIEVLEKQAERKVPFEEARPRIEGMLKQRQLEQQVKGRVNELAAQAKIEILL